MKVKIQSSNPIPKKKTGSCIWRETFSKMKKGDSFKVQKQSVRQSIYRHAKYHGIKVTTRKLNGAGFEVWRTN